MKTHTHTHKYLFIVTVMTLMSSCGLLAEDTAAEKARQEQTIIDTRLEAQIATTFALSPYLRANELKVTVKEGTATLTGKVDEEVNKDLAKQMALGVNGIKTVTNDIEVIPGYTPPSSAEGRSFGTYIDDASITAAVKSKLLWSKHAKGLATDVDTKYGKVTLLGTADTDIAKTFAGKLAMNTNGVKSVDNQLKVKTTTAADQTKANSEANAATNSDNDSEQPFADTWITTKVKSTFMYTSNISGSDISVDTKNGIVNLSGTVDSGAERELAIELAENIRGVKSVEASKLKQ